jgi:hypothetical protein
MLFHIKNALHERCFPIANTQLFLYNVLVSCRGLSTEGSPPKFPSDSTVKFHHPVLAALVPKLLLKRLGTDSLSLWECRESQWKGKDRGRENQACIAISIPIHQITRKITYLG